MLFIIRLTKLYLTAYVVVVLSFVARFGCNAILTLSLVVLVGFLSCFLLMGSVLINDMQTPPLPQEVVKNIAYVLDDFRQKKLLINKFLSKIFNHLA